MQRTTRALAPHVPADEKSSLVLPNERGTLAATVGPYLRNVANDSAQASRTFRITSWSQVLSGSSQVGDIRAEGHGLRFTLIRAKSTTCQWHHMQRALALLAEGASNAMIASELDVSEATISRHVTATLQGCGGVRAAVPVIARVLNELPPLTSSEQQLDVLPDGPSEWSTSEREVARLSLQGFSPCEIADHRQAAVPTIRAQLRSAARKVNSCDRYEIGASRKVRLIWRPSPATDGSTPLSAGQWGAWRLVTV